jgi:hypothetical protein
MCPHCPRLRLVSVGVGIFFVRGVTKERRRTLTTVPVGGEHQLVLSLYAVGA